ncbi:MAG: hypothetical protein KKF12_09960 [Proteobacteria bacterium]|nr:hypothetical protein [Pseudomonadota bacterium]MBU4131131.1 hypothetical protein [Pseudomonadota bacterium]
MNLTIIKASDGRLTLHAKKDLSLIKDRSFFLIILTYKTGGLPKLKK